MVEGIKKISQKRLKHLRTCFKINYVCEVRSGDFRIVWKTLLMH